MIAARDRPPLLQVKHVEKLISRALRQRRGFSFVRLGDSEGALLGYNPATATSEDELYLQTLFGPDIDAGHLLELAGLLREALLTADLIGNRDDVWEADHSAQALTGDEPDFSDRFRSALKLRDVEKNLDPHALRRLFGLHTWTIGERRTSIPICSSWVAYDLALVGFWERVLRSQSSVMLINCSPTLPNALKEIVGVDVDFIRIPDMASHRDRWSDDDLTEKVYPDSFNRVKQVLDVPQTRRLCIIGAGVPGKAYASIIKRQGGIALDLGGLLDAWDGRLTRPLVYATKNKRDASHLPFMLKQNRAPSKFFGLVKTSVKMK